MAGAFAELDRLREWRVVVDARECRQIAHRTDGCGETDIPSGVDALQTWLRAWRPHAVVIHLGHNGRMGSEDFDILMTNTAGVSTVVWLTLAQPQKWRTSNNDVIRDGVARWRQASLLDWCELSAGQPWFRSDGLHLERAGAVALANVLAEALIAQKWPLRLALARGGPRRAARERRARLT
jgi:hypothetical protein